MNPRLPRSIPGSTVALLLLATPINAAPRLPTAAFTPEAAPRPQTAAITLEAATRPPAAPARPVATARPATTAHPGTISLHGSVSVHDLQAWQLEARLTSPAPIELSCVEVGTSLERHRLTSPAADLHRLTVRGLKASTRYRCEAAALDGSSRRSDAFSFVTAPLPSNLKPPAITVPSSDVAKTGYTLYNYGKSGTPRTAADYLVILDAEGNIRWYYSGKEKVGGGDVDASYLGDDRILYGGDVNNHFPPTIVGLDKTIQYKARAEKSTPTELSGSWSHDAGRAAEGSSIFTITMESLNYLVGGPSTPVYAGFVIKEIDPATDRTVWYWSSAADGAQAGVLPWPDEPYSAQSYFPYDPYHGNSVVDQWENGRLFLYVGMRDNNRVIKIDYLTGDVVWTLGVDGDFTLLEPDGRPASDDRWFFSQHDAQPDGHAVTMYDNGYDRPLYGGTAYSRALRLELDETAMTARIAFEYTEPNWLEAIFGGVDGLENGDHLIALGHIQGYDNGPHPSALIEVDASGKVVWRADFPELSENIYRADRIDGCAIFDNTRYCP